MSEQNTEADRLHDLMVEFHTANKYAIIDKLAGERSELLQENADLRRERDAARADTERVLDALSERDAVVKRTRLDLAAVRQQLDDARVVVAQVEEASAFLAEAAGHAAAERDRALAELQASEQEHAHSTRIGLHLIRANRRLKRAALRLYHASKWAAAWKAAAKHFRFLFLSVKEELQITGEITARFRVERDEWRQAAEEAQEAAMRYRDADVAALVRAAGEVVPILESFKRALEQMEPADVGHCPACGPEDYCSNHESQLVLMHIIPGIKAALRPFRRFAVPVCGEIGETAEEWETLRQRVEADEERIWQGIKDKFGDPRAMTPERIDAARPAGMASDETTT